MWFSNIVFLPIKKDDVPKRARGNETNLIHGTPSGFYCPAQKNRESPRPYWRKALILPLEYREPVPERVCVVHTVASCPVWNYHSCFQAGNTRRSWIKIDSSTQLFVCSWLRRVIACEYIYSLFCNLRNQDQCGDGDRGCGECLLCGDGSCQLDTCSYSYSCGFEVEREQIWIGKAS